MKTSITSYQDYEKRYSDFKDQNLEGRYLTFDHLENSLKELRSLFEIKQIGISTLGTPIEMISAGHGKIKILAWSQMHGNESTTTKAVLDLLNSFRLFRNEDYIASILKNIQIRIIPMLNPDGAKAYTRVNANEIDLNRDAHNREEVESRVLRDVYEEFEPHYCFNLHDQRTIFSAGQKTLPATLSFLTPAMNEERALTPEREASMKVIVAMNQNLQQHIPGMIGRYSDEYNINCTGDTFQTMGVPTVLFEAGHYYNDYHRENVRKFMVFALVTALETIATGEVEALDAAHYFKIPQNEKLFFDVILRKAIVEGQIVDVAIQFKEELNGNKIEFVPYVEKIGPALNYYGHKEIDCEEKEVKHEDGNKLSENVIVHNLLVKGVVLIIKYANK
ncbi:MAG TPA: M14 family zinc carboxypeptidase [Gillisia sp.]|nr:M14 family zinc carboxypeptidase [Gillisia sp.]